MVTTLKARKPPPKGKQRRDPKQPSNERDASMPPREDNEDNAQLAAAAKKPKPFGAAPEKPEPDARTDPRMATKPDALDPDDPDPEFGESTSAAGDAALAGAGLDPKKKGKANFAEIGVTGLKVFSGVVDEEFLSVLRGERGRKIFREMADNDATVGAVLAAIALLIRSCKWRAEPKDESEQAQAEALFAESIFADMSHTWEDFISEVLSMLVYGWSYMEVVYKQRVGPDETDPSKRSEYNDNRIGVRKLAIRSQLTLSRWEMQDDGGIDGMWQYPPLGTPEVLIPIERALLFRTTSRLNSPEGMSILRTAYQSWYFLKRIREYEAIGIERELAGLPVVRIPGRYTFADATDAQKAFYAKAVAMARDLKFNEQGGLVVPSDPWFDNDGAPVSGTKQFDIELIKSAGARAIDTTAVKNDYKRDITRCALADFLMLGQDKGAYNLGESKTDLFLKAIESVMSQIAAPINRYLLPRLWSLNGLPPETRPTMKPGEIGAADLEKLGAFLTAASGAGMPLFPDEQLEAHLRAAADFPEKSEEAMQAQEEERLRQEEQEAAMAEAMGQQPLPGQGKPFEGASDDDEGAAFPPKVPGQVPPTARRPQAGAASRAPLGQAPGKPGPGQPGFGPGKSPFGPPKPKRPSPFGKTAGSSYLWLDAGGLVEWRKGDTFTLPAGTAVDGDDDFGDDRDTVIKFTDLPFPDGVVSSSDLIFKIDSVEDHEGLTVVTVSDVGMTTDG